MKKLDFEIPTSYETGTRPVMMDFEIPTSYKNWI